MMATTATPALPRKYFLYIDILGFSHLVLTQGQVKELYRRFDSLNAHRHPSFTAIVFSDTMLVFNKDDLDWDEGDIAALVTRLCEFASDLFYRLISQNIHFRAYICCGEFDHAEMQHIDAFYGPALIHAYKREREIQCTGLFVDNDLVPYLHWFHSAKYDDQCHFVHLVQTLDAISFDNEADYPLNADLVEPADSDVWAAYELTYLTNIHTLMHDMSLLPRARVKYLSTWQMIQTRHKALLNVLERTNFDPKAICDMNWAPSFSKIGTAQGFFE
jgi:hypothetical protein